MELSPQALWASTGTPVRIIIAIMVLMLVLCIYVAVERTIAFMRARKQSRLLAEAISGPLQSGDTAGALEVVRRDAFQHAYLGHMLLAGLTEFAARPDRHGIEAAGRALEKVSITEGASLRKGLNILATTGATAPFVGLVGTIFGIINAFASMAATGGGGLGAVSAGIAEALVTTAIGIMVAIVGVWMFNFFNGWIESIVNDMSVSTQEFVDWAEKQLWEPTESAAK